MGRGYLSCYGSTKPVVRALSVRSGCAGSFAHPFRNRASQAFVASGAFQHPRMHRSGLIRYSTSPWSSGSIHSYPAVSVLLQRKGDGLFQRHRPPLGRRGECSLAELGTPRRYVPLTVVPVL